MSPQTERVRRRPPHSVSSRRQSRTSGTPRRSPAARRSPPASHPRSNDRVPPASRRSRITPEGTSRYWQSRATGTGTVTEPPAPLWWADTVRPHCSRSLLVRLADACPSDHWTRNVRGTARIGARPRRLRVGPDGRRHRTDVPCGRAPGPPAGSGRLALPDCLRDGLRIRLPSTRLGSRRVDWPGRVRAREHYLGPLWLADGRCVRFCGLPRSPTRDPRQTATTGRGPSRQSMVRGARPLFRHLRHLSVRSEGLREPAVVPRQPLGPRLSTGATARLFTERSRWGLLLAVKRNKRGTQMDVADVLRVEREPIDRQIDRRPTGPAERQDPETAGW